MKRQRSAIAIAVLAAMLLAGCVSRGTHPPTPYLGSLEGMSDSQRDDKFKREYFSDDAERRVALRRVEKVQIADLRFDYLEDRAKHEQALQKLNTSYRTAFESVLGEAGIQIVPPDATADPSTLRIESSLVKIYTPNRMLNVLTTILVGPITNGGAAFETQLVDVGSRQPVAKIAEEQKGAWHLGSLTIGGYMKYYDTERVFGAWAKRLRDLLTGEE